MARATLVIGVGGTGQKTLHHIKRRLQAATAGPRPPVKLLSFDTDTQEKPEKLDATEFTHLQIQSGNFQNMLRGLPAHRPEIAEWFPEPERYPGLRNIKTLRDGAAQVRACGRLVFFDNADAIQKSLQIQLAVLAQAQTQLVHEGELPTETVPKSSGIDVFIVSSLSGGTGSGMCLDFAGLLKGVFESDYQLNVYGIFLQPDLFEGVVPMQNLLRIRANNYSALKEINHFMAPESLFKVAYSKATTISAACPVFDAVFLLGKLNGRGVPVDNLRHAGVMVGDFIHEFAVEGLGDKFYKTQINNAIEGATRHIARNGLRTWISSMGTHLVSWPLDEIRDYWTARESSLVLAKLLGEIPLWEGEAETRRQAELRRAAQLKDKEKLERLTAQKTTLDDATLESFVQTGFPEMAREFAAKKRIPERVRGKEGVLASRFHLTPPQVLDVLYPVHTFKKGLDLDTFKGQRLSKVEAGLKSWARGKDALIESIQKGSGQAAADSLAQKVDRLFKEKSQEIAETVERYLNEHREKGLAYLLMFLHHMHETLEGYATRLRSESRALEQTEQARSREFDEKLAHVSDRARSLVKRLFAIDLVSLEILETGHAMHIARLQRLLNDAAADLYTRLSESVAAEFASVSAVITKVRLAARTLEKKCPELLQRVLAVEAGQTEVANTEEHLRDYHKRFVEPLDLYAKVSLPVASWRKASEKTIASKVLAVLEEQLRESAGRQRVLDYVTVERRSVEQSRLVDMLRAKADNFLRFDTGAERFDPFEVAQITCGYARAELDLTRGIPWTGTAEQRQAGPEHQIRLTNIYMGLPPHVIEGMDQAFRAYETLVMQRNKANRVPVHLFSGALHFQEISGQPLFPDGSVLLSLAQSVPDPLPLKSECPPGQINEKQKRTPIVFRPDGGNHFAWWETRRADDNAILEIRLRREALPESDFAQRLSQDPELSTLVQERIWATLEQKPKSALRKAFSDPRYLTPWLKEQFEAKFGMDFFTRNR